MILADEILSFQLSAKCDGTISYASIIRDVYH